MKKQNVKRRHNFSDEELIELCENLMEMSKVVENWHQLKKAGYTSGDGRSLKLAYERFKDFPDDGHLEGAQVVYTDQKDKHLGSMRSAIAEVMAIVARTDGTDSANYRRFNARRLRDRSQYEQLIVGYQVERIGKLLFNRYERKGMTERMIERVRVTREAAMKATMRQWDGIYERDQAVIDRVTLGNELYDQLVILCEAGRAGFKREPEKQKNYIIYERNGGTAAAG